MPAPQASLAGPTRRVRLALAAAFAVLGVVSACVDGRAPTALDLIEPTFLNVAPSFNAVGLASNAPEINRIQITVRRVGSDSILTVDTTDVNPTDPEWVIDLSVGLAAGSSAELELTIELINRQPDGTQTTEYAARVRQRVRQGQNPTVRQTDGLRGPVDNLTVDSVVANAPARGTLIETDTITLTGTTFGGGPSARHFWSSLTPTLAEVTVDGTVTTLLPGTARLVATAGPRADTVSLAIIQKVAGISIVPNPALIQSIGGTVTVALAAVDPRGVEVVESGVEYELLEGIAVEDLGDTEFRALHNGEQLVALRGFRLTPLTAAGDAGLRAVDDTAVFDTATVVVEQQAASFVFEPDSVHFDALGDTVELSADASDALDVPMPDAEIVWASTDPAVATVTPEGLVLPVSSGSAFARATQGTFSDSVPIVVDQIITEFGVVPANDTVFAVGDTARFVAQALDSAGFDVPLTGLAWTSSSVLVATVSATGLATAVDDGTAILTVTVDTLTAEGTFVVHLDSDVSGLDVRPDSLTVKSSERDTLTAVLLDLRGRDRLFPDTLAAVWTSDDPSIAEVNSAGVVTGRQLGTTLVWADVGPLSDTSVVTVEPGAAANVEISPTTQTAGTIGDTLVYSATALDEAGNGILGATFAWSTVSTAVAEVVETSDSVADSGGDMFTVSIARVVARGAGATSLAVLASVGGVEAADTAEVVVELEPASVTVAPATPTLTALEATTALAATAFDAGGATISGAPFTWETSDGAIATVDASGVVTAVGNGAATITASTGGVSGTATVTVSVPVGGIRIVPDYAAVGVGGTAAFTGEVTDAAGAELTGVTVAWSSTDGEIVAVDASGVATGDAVGVGGVRGAAGALADTAVIAVADGSTLISTALVDGKARPEVEAGAQISVVVKLDMSFVAGSGDVGAAQFDLTYDDTVLTFVSAAIGIGSGIGDFNGDTPGTVSFAMASTGEQGTTDVTLLTVTFDVGVETAGAVTALGLDYTAVPSRTDLTSYGAEPLTVAARLRVISP